MLEIRNVTKVYRSKTGEQVVALNNVSISFPETGMVFILGKSGSGKSTLLNVIGGLDGYDSGEFVIQGKSSRDFKGSDFDAYRNTFIGFIFQEYNILDDFSVGANIGLALELQGKKATEETINNILAQVDLVNYANRKPNELSGGQKQRIAIARALVKDPQIIMADEPTGALDSNTGKQIFDTLKELSRRKLVLIVSHDRDFAERYADRIIELADGNIISDVTKHEQAAKVLNEGIREVSDKILRIKAGYRLTARDLDMINSYLAKSENGVVLSGDARVNDELRSAAGLSEDGGSTVFESTDPQKDLTIQQYDGSKTHFIRSRLPMKNAVKMGASGLKHKKFRLFMTILLSLVAFSMFGIADTMAAYKKAETATRSIMDSNIDNASFALSVKTTYYDNYDGKERSSVYYNGDTMNDEDIKTLSEKTGVEFIPVFNGGTDSGSINLSNNMQTYNGAIPAYKASMSGFVSMSAAQLAAANLTVTGRLPENDSEIAIPKFLYDQFNQYGFKNDQNGHNEKISATKLTMDATGGTNSIIGKHLTVGNGFIRKDDGNDFEFTIVGIVETHFDTVRYASLLEENKGGLEGGLSDMLLQVELNDTLTYGFHTLGFVTKSAIEAMSVNALRYSNRREIGIYTNNIQIRWDNDENPDNGSMMQFYRVAGASELTGAQVTRLDGTPFTTLGPKEYLVSRSAYTELLNNSVPKTDAVPNYANMTAKYETLFTSAARDWANNRSNNFYSKCYDAAAYQYAENHYAANESDLNARGIWSVDDYAQDLVNSWSEEVNTIAENARAELVIALGEDLGLDLSTAPAEVKKYFKEDILQNQIQDGQSLDFYTVRQWVARYYAGVAVFQNGLLDDLTWADLENWIGYSRSDWNEMTPEGQKRALFDRLTDLYCNNYYDSEPIGGMDTLQVIKQTNSAFQALTGVSVPTEEAPALRKSEYDYSSGTNISKGIYEGYSLAGYFTVSDDPYGEYFNLLVSDEIKADVQESSKYFSYTVQADHASGIWTFAIAPMPADRALIRNMVDLSYSEEDTDIRFHMRNQVMTTLDSFNSFIEIAAKVFLYIGIGFAVFSALLLMNFISVSISYKRHEIGILRAVGARSSDVFKIFFSESFIIALINYLLAVVATIVTVFSINRSFRNQGLNVTLLTFGSRQLALMFLISLGVAAIASFLPVWNIARRRPIDAIRNR